MGILYQGLALMGGGAILGGLVLGAIGVFVIEQDFVKAAAFSSAGCLLTFFGFMHGEAIGIAVTPLVASAYLIVTLLLLACHRFATLTTPVPVDMVNETPEASY